MIMGDNKRWGKVNLYLESATDYSISMIGPDRIVRTITPEKAKELWLAGKVADFNLAFQRLAGFDFDVAAVQAYYSRRA
jgi:hypothetical protein